MSQHTRNIDFIGIGAQKAATTWLAKCLDEHPQIATSTVKEVNFFNSCDEFYLPAYNNYKKGKYWYHDNFPQKKDGIKILGEFSTSYLSDPAAYERIYKYDKDIKIICCVRDPYERMYSQYVHILRKRPFLEKHLGSFVNAIKSEPGFLERSLYGKHLQKYYNLFPSQQIHLIRYEDIKKHPADVLKKLYDFLEVETKFIPASINTEINKNNKIARSYKLNSLITRIHRHGLGSKVIFKLLKLLNTKKRNDSNNISKIPKEITKIVDSDINLLNDITGLNFNDWKSIKKNT